MTNLILALCLITISYHSISAEDISASELITDIYSSCISQFSTSCVKPKALAWISHAVNQDTIKITEDLSIIRTGDDEFDTESRAAGSPVIGLFDKIDSFLSSHSLRVETPEILRSNEARAYIPRSLLSGGIAEGLQLPLVEGNAVEGQFKYLLCYTVTPFSYFFFFFSLISCVNRSLIREESDDSIHFGLEV